MKTIQTLALVVALTAATATASFAQTGHSHLAPHGGVVQEANGYHVEMVKVKETLNFYLLGADGKASKKAATGKVEFKFANKTKSTSSLSAGKNGALHTALPKANIFEYCTAILTVDGKTVKARFKNTVSEAAKAHGHEH